MPMTNCIAFDAKKRFCQIKIVFCIARKIDPPQIVPLPGGETFNLQTFINEKEAQTEWIASQLPSMLEFIESMPDRTKPAATLRALVHQDHESLHRKIKMNWANRNGQTVFSNQHDGIGAGLDAEHDANTVAKALSDEITATCGYDVKVDAKQMDHKRPQVNPYVWPVQKIGSTKGSPYVVVTPMNFENTIRASFEDVWHDRVQYNIE